jgi:hypothetical protein
VHNVVDRLADRQFPDTDPNDPIDNIILHCWFTKFKRTVDLLYKIVRVAENISGSEGIRAIKSMSNEKYLAKKELYKGFHCLFQAIKVAAATSFNSTHDSARLSLSEEALMELKHHCIYDQFRSIDKCKNRRKLLKLTEAFRILFVFNTTKGVWDNYTVQ